MRKATSRADKLQRLVEGAALTREKPSKEKEDDFTLKTVFEAETNKLTFRCYNRLKFEFTIHLAQGILTTFGNS